MSRKKTTPRADLSTPAEATQPDSRPLKVAVTRVFSLYDPVVALEELFHHVQMEKVFRDGKTFVDARPKSPPAEILERYRALRSNPDFDLRAFVEHEFEVPSDVIDTSGSMEAHIRALWSDLTRQPDTDLGSSLLPLANAYVVPGGRFREVYYWDSYFTMLGLLECGHADLARSILDNFAQMVRTLGHVPNGNRTYYLTRSQPPFLGAMVALHAAHAGNKAALAWLDALEAEHAFWMDGATGLKRGEAHRRVVRLPDGSLLNRYWDDAATPRPEMYSDDYTEAQTLPEAERAGYYRNVRAAAESGWDFSSRWMRDPSDLRTLETVELAPVDLNCILYRAEQTIAALRLFRGHPGDAVVAHRFSGMAARRRRVLQRAAFDASTGWFHDIRWRTGQRVTDRFTLAAAVPLYFGVATPTQARAVARCLERDFLKPGGFVTSTIVSGQQWDAPNGWPPLQWMTIEGLRRYGQHPLAADARDRWLRLNRTTYNATGRMMEKYDVVDPDRPAGGGEYATQDGFGWTNGVALALIAQDRAERTSAAPTRARRRARAGAP
jgi:alpha,alpha-trehalase